MRVWVKSRNGDERAFKVEFQNEMDFDDLMLAITQKRNSLSFPAGAVESVHSENSNEEIFILRTGAKVPNPADGQIGSSEDLPYFFSITRQTLPAEPATIKSILSANAQEYVCRMTLINEVNEKRICIPVAVDSGFMGDMELEPTDVAELDLISTGQEDIILADYVTVETVLKYARVRVEVELNDGSIVHAYLNPTSPIVVTPEAGVGAICEVSTKRLLGYDGLKALGLKLDARKALLVRRKLLRR